jgi:hypothetical protein
VERCLNTDTEYLYELNCSTIKMVAKYLDIPTLIDDIYQDTNCWKNG